MSAAPAVPAPPPPGAAVGAAAPSPLVPLRLAWFLARRGTGLGRATLALPVVAFGSITTLLLTVLAGGLSFFRWDDDLAAMYQLLAGLALVLLLVPLVVLGGAAARLSARRRDDRLATLRLLGATPAAVAQVAVVEAGALALAGALAGVLGYLVAGPLVSLLHFRGEPIGAAYWLPAHLVLTAVAGVVLLAVVSATAALRRVVISPLGVRTRQTPPSPRAVRAVVGVGVLAAAVLALSSPQPSVAVAAVVVLGAFAAGLAVLNLVGPWVVGRLARRRLRRARTAAELLTARSIGDAPKAVWRQVSAVAMAGFVAVVAGTGVALMGGAETSSPDEAYLVTDIRTGVIITLLGVFVMVACSTGVNQAAEVLDRADVYRSLTRLGAPVATIEAARTATVMVPVTRVAAGSALVGGVLVLPLAGFALLVDPLTVTVVLLALVSGVALVRVSLLATRPVLRSVLR